MIRTIRGAFAALLLALAWAAPAQAEEKILSYDSDVAIQKDGSLDEVVTMGQSERSRPVDASGPEGKGGPLRTADAMPEEKTK